MIARRRLGHAARGQALVEFSLILVPFLVIFMGIVDLGRGVYMNSGVSQAAREIARVTAVHPCADPDACVLGSSSETLAVISTQQALVPGLGDSLAQVTFDCTTVNDTVVTTPCGLDVDTTHFIRVSVEVPFSVLTPVLGAVAPTQLQATAHIEVP